MAAVTIALKDLRLLARDRVALFWVLGFPLLFALLFGSVLSAVADDSGRTFNLVLVDDVDSPQSRALLAALASAPGFSTESASRDAAHTLVRRGERLAFVRVRDVSGELGLELGVDPTRAGESRALSAALARATTPSDGAGALPPLNIDTIEVGRTSEDSSFAIAFPAALLWGLMGSAASFAVSWVAERARGTDLRLRSAPISGATVLAGKALACFLACVLGSGVLVVFGWAALGIVAGSWLAVVASVVSIALCFVGLTTLLGMLGRTEQAVAGAGWATLILLAMLGGAMVPLAAMPDWLRRASDVSPVKWGISALEGAYFRDFSGLELLGPCAVLLGMGVAAFALGLELMARRAR